MKFKADLFAAARLAVACLALAVAVYPCAVTAQTGAGTDSGSGQASGRGQRRRGGADFPGGGRGILGAVTDVTPEHYTIKTDAGDVYTVHYSVNTRIMKQPPGGVAGSGAGSGAGRGARRNPGDDADRPQPTPLKPTEIKVGDFITAGGEMDQANKSLGAVFILQLDPESAKQMREMQANFGKTWLAGRITAIDGTRITIEGSVDHVPHAIEVDENTSFRKRREAITLADMQPGDQIRLDGAMKEGAFRATNLVDLGEFQRDGGAPGPIPGPVQPH
jgi:hypothetical protein